MVLRDTVAWSAERGVSVQCVLSDKGGAYNTSEVDNCLPALFAQCHPANRL